MYFKYDRMEHKTGLIGRSGKEYEAVLLHGTKLGYQDAPDIPYTKTIFPQAAITVIHGGNSYNNCSTLEFFKTCKPGQLVNVKTERDGKYFRWVSVEKMESRGVSREFSKLPYDEESKPWID